MYFRPPAANRSRFGVEHGPPNTLDAPNPTSSIRITSTFGAPAGGRSGTSRWGDDAVSGSLASKVVNPTGATSGIGKVRRKLTSGSLIGPISGSSLTAE